MTVDGMLNIVAAGLIITCLANKSDDFRAGLVILVFGLVGCVAILTRTVMLS